MTLTWRTKALAATLLAAATAGAALVAAQPFDPPPDRRRAVGDWLVEHVAEEDGGRIVRMTREGEGFQLVYRTSHWRGNHHPYRSGEISWHGCSRGGEESEAEALPAPAVRALLTDWLGQCDASPGEARALLEGFERAFALSVAWNEDAQAATEAEVQAIVDYPNSSWPDENGMAPDNVTACELNQMNETGSCAPY
jgi:hypothetical protein